MSFALRCDYDRAADSSRLSDWFGANADSYLVVYEEVDGENPHIHAGFHSTKTLDALRKSFKRAFEEKRGNGAYSLKKADDMEGYMRYMCKGSAEDKPPQVEFRQGFDFSEERIAEAHAGYWRQNAALKESSARRAELKGANMVEVVEKLCKEEGVRSYDRKAIARVYIRVMKKARKPINLFAARAVVNGVVVALDDTDSGPSEDIVTSIANL